MVRAKHALSTFWTWNLRSLIHPLRVFPGPNYDITLWHTKLLWLFSTGPTATGATAALNASDHCSWGLGKPGGLPEQGFQRVAIQRMVSCSEGDRFGLHLRKSPGSSDSFTPDDVKKFGNWMTGCNWKAILYHLVYQRKLLCFRHGRMFQHIMLTCYPASRKQHLHRPRKNIGSCVKHVFCA